MVDTAAWTEEIPVYATVEWSKCNNCGADITGNEAKHFKDSLLSGGQCGSWSSAFKQVQTGTKQIYHEEVGHWENVLVCGGCTGAH